MASPQLQGEPQIAGELISRLRDAEEKQRLLKERTLLIGQTLIDEKTNNFAQRQETKKLLMQLKEETRKLSELTKRMMEQMAGFARKEELMMLQRQFDMFRKA